MQLTWQPYAPTPQPGSTDLLPAEPLPETSDYYYTDVIAYQTMTALPLCLIMMPT